MVIHTIPINILLDRIRRNPLLSDIPFETVVDYVVDFMEIEGFPALFNEKVATIKIKDYRALLPIDCNEIKTVRGFLPAEFGNKPIGYRESTDSFYKSPNKRFKNDFTYKISGSIIYTSIESGDLEVVYDAFKTDINGFPMIPDNRKFFIALESYIKMKHFEMLFEQGKLQPAVMERADREYAWAVGACESEFHKIAYDRAESLGNQWRQILINTREHTTGYANLGVAKDFKIN